MRWYWWLWVLLMWWMMFGCGDPTPVHVNVEEKPSYPKVGSGSERDSSTGIRALDTPSAGSKRRERDSDGDRRD
jgi:hypothetical protein